MLLGMKRMLNKYELASREPLKAQKLTLSLVKGEDAMSACGVSLIEIGFYKPQVGVAADLVESRKHPTLFSHFELLVNPSIRCIARAGLDVGQDEFGTRHRHHFDFTL